MGSGASCEQSASSPFHAKLMAQDTLPVPVSGSSVERMFSAAGHIATCRDVDNMLNSYS